MHFQKKKGRREKRWPVKNKGGEERKKNFWSSQFKSVQFSLSLALLFATCMYRVCVVCAFFRKEKERKKRDFK